MAKYLMRNISQGLLLLPLVLLACSTISAARISARSIDGMKTIEPKNTVVIDGNVNGCFHNPFPHYESENFCCNKDNMCWPSLQECIPNCPCKVNCGTKVPEANKSSRVHG